MYKYVKFDENSGLCTEVGTGTNEKFYQSIGMVYTDVEQSEVDGQWYLTAKCPHYSDEEKEQQKQQKESEEKELALQAAIEELGKEMAKADLAGDEEWKEDLRAEYEALIMESEE
jgi:mannitol-1-phosphate/altronate dehydrogenase